MSDQCERFTIYRGDHFKLEVTLEVAGEAYAIPEGATVRLGLRGTHRETLAPELIGGPWTASEDHSEADWSTGKVVLEVSAEDSADLPLRRNLAIEACVTSDSEPLTWVSTPATISIEAALLHA